MNPGALTVRACRGVCRLAGVGVAAEGENSWWEVGSGEACVGPCRERVEGLGLESRIVEGGVRCGWTESGGYLHIDGLWAIYM